MIDFMETLLVAWGKERLNPSIEASIRSPLGQVGEGGGGVGGSRCLSTVEVFVAQSRAVLAVEAALQAVVVEQGAAGRVLLQLAEVRYCRAPALTVVEQHRALGIARRTYRARVDLLHCELAERVPAAARQLSMLEAGSDAAKARAAYLAKARKRAAAEVRARLRAAKTKAA